MPREINPYCSICGVLKTPENTITRKCRLKPGSEKYFQSECKECMSVLTNVTQMKKESLKELHSRIFQYEGMLERVNTVIQNPDMKPRDIAKLLRGKS
jgi:hypothetical protein